MDPETNHSNEYPWGNNDMAMPDAALTSTLRQLSTTTGMAIRVVHPGKLRGDEAREVFSGLSDEALDLLSKGEPHLLIETDPLLATIERGVVSALVANAARIGSTAVWAAFFSDDGCVDVVLPKSGTNVVHGPFGLRSVATA
jgi:hypothetical protein